MPGYWLVTPYKGILSQHLHFAKGDVLTFLWHLSKTNATNATMSSVPYFENRVPYFVQNRRK